jgi:mycoredoxin
MPIEPPPAAPARTWFDRHTPTFAARYRASRVQRFLTWTVIVLLPVAVALHLYGVVNKRLHDPRRQPPGAITVLLTENCPYSRDLEAALKGARISYRRLDIDKDDGAAWAFYAVNARGVPVTVVGDEVVYGLRTNLLRSTLQKAGRDVTNLRFRRETDLPLSTNAKP